MNLWHQAAGGRPPNKQLDALIAIMDRVLGKPVQAVMNANLELTREQQEAQLKELLDTFPGLPEPQTDGDSKPKPN
jgi:hypothetical protein